MRQDNDYYLSNIGSLIDVANQAGGSSVSGISFGLQNPDPYVQQALGMAAKQALAHASAPSPEAREPKQARWFRPSRVRLIHPVRER